MTKRHEITIGDYKIVSFYQEAQEQSIVIVNQAFYNAKGDCELYFDSYYRSWSRLVKVINGISILFCSACFVLVKEEQIEKVYTKDLVNLNTFMTTYQVELLKMDIDTATEVYNTLISHNTKIVL